MDDAPDRETETLSDVAFFGAGAGTSFVVALFCVMTPFFLQSDILSSLLLLGFFIAASGTCYFAYRSYRAEQHFQKSYEETVEELAAMRRE